MSVLLTVKNKIGFQASEGLLSQVSQNENVNDQWPICDPSKQVCQIKTRSFKNEKMATE